MRDLEAALLQDLADPLTRYALADLLEERAMGDVAQLFRSEASVSLFVGECLLKHCKLRFMDQENRGEFVHVLTKHRTNKFHRRAVFDNFAVAAVRISGTFRLDAVYATAKDLMELGYGD